MDRGPCTCVILGLVLGVAGCDEGGGSRDHGQVGG